ncbi:MAG: DUF4190 domain-containing protein [Phycisphaeraceae bacterium]
MVQEPYDPDRRSPGPDPVPADPSQGQASQSARIHCIRCGYDLTGVALGGVCPECGTPLDRSLYPTQAASGFAVASMVLGIVSLAMCPGSGGAFSIVCGPLAIVFWHVAHKQRRDGLVGPRGDGMATAGLVTGIIGTVLGVIGVVSFGSMFFLPFMI